MSRLPVLKRLSTRPPLRIVRDENEAVILPFLRRSWRAPLEKGLRPSAPRTSTIDFPPPANRMDPLTRARVLYDNRCCPQCRRARVIPLDLCDGDDRNAAMPVPGSSTLVGFFCDACGAEWPI